MASDMTSNWNAEKVSKWANYLDAGMLEAHELERITAAEPELGLEDAYAIQQAGIRLREARGEKIIGYKMGLTSKAKREQMGLHAPVYGVLTDRMQVRGNFHLKGTIHPKIEPEIAFLIGKQLSGKVTESDVLAACSGVAAALEILDSRYKGFKYFSLPDVVADNSSSAWFTVGEFRKDFSGLNLAALGMRMSVNGQLAQQAVSSEISGSPVQSVIQLCELLAGHGKVLPAGSIVLAGAATVAVQLEPGMTVQLDVDSLPPVRLSHTL